MTFFHVIIIGRKTINVRRPGKQMDCLACLRDQNTLLMEEEEKDDETVAGSKKLRQVATKKS